MFKIQVAFGILQINSSKVTDMQILVLVSTFERKYQPG